jgi:hypothetical protein
MSSSGFYQVAAPKATSMASRSILASSWGHSVARGAAIE